MKQFGDRQVGDLIVDRRTEEDDPLAEQTRVDVEGALTVDGLLDHHRDLRAHRCSLLPWFARVRARFPASQAVVAAHACTCTPASAGELHTRLCRQRDRSYEPETAGVKRFLLSSAGSGAPTATALRTPPGRSTFSDAA
jgi:hypothetical protein